MFTEPEFVRRWWAGRHGNVTSVEIDLRVGGTWRYVMEADGGFEVAFHGEYREIVPGERFVTTEVFEGAPPSDTAPPVSTYTFAEHAGTTTLTLLTTTPDRATRDAIIDSGMKSGMQEGYDIVDELAAALVA